MIPGSATLLQTSAGAFDQGGRRARPRLAAPRGHGVRDIKLTVGRVVARLQGEATRRGGSIDDVITELAARLPADATAVTRRTLAFASPGDSAAGITTRLDETLAESFGRD